MVIDSYFYTRSDPVVYWLWPHLYRWSWPSPYLYRFRPVGLLIVPVTILESNRWCCSGATIGRVSSFGKCFDRGRQIKIIVKKTSNYCQITVKLQSNYCQLTVKLLSNYCQINVKSLWHKSNSLHITVKRLYNSRKMPVKLLPHDRQNSCIITVK